MIVYLDASVLVAMFTDDASSARADAFIQNSELSFHISNFAAAELASAMSTPVIQCVEDSDISSAESFLRRLDLNLRAPDAIHIAIALRTGASLATFDERMATCAHDLGLAVAPA